MKSLILNFLFCFGFISSGFAVTSNEPVSNISEAPMLISPATVHQIFKSCRRSGLYGCALKGRVIVAAFSKSNSTAVVPAVSSDEIYDAYWWPDHCVPAASLQDAGTCEFNLLLLPTTSKGFW